ncbi:glycosyltransferase [Streptomyces qinzhouensis]|uniref:Glycosyltransferase family 1 protein n=1 Tax=Streptomyces qinzhouensis TaxID=2599401 RepID=A0A5B8J5G1_9ACTN|nr:glycosyltransferase [Streptomyces qinzhouensis]QDY75271.1 glycosyltransferase family 1 protein [Streptomyces qinzhouensis]
MRVAVMTAGSRGDVAPFTGLGHGLARAGHEVTLVTHERFGPLAEAAGIGFRPLPVDPLAELESASGRGLHRSGTGAGKLVRVVALARAVAGELSGGLLAAAADSDLLLLSVSVAPLGLAIAEGLNLPSLGVYLQPHAVTGEFAPPMIGTRSLGRSGNRLATRAVNAAVDAVFTEAVHELRAGLGLPRAGSRAARRAREAGNWPVLHGFSERIVPRPADWRSGLRVAGYWWPYDAPSTALPAGLSAFLDAGPPPVFVGLGSATTPDPERVGATVVRALRAAGLRGVVQSGWAGLRAEGDDMLTIGEVPHRDLFPRMAAVVHACGAGTTAAGLRAGVPAVPVPVQFDQSFWAARLTALGVAPGAVPLRGLTAPALTAALRKATGDESYRVRARALAALLAREDGIGPVLAAVEARAGG